MKKLLLLFSISCLSFALQAQQLPNTDFEAWQNVGNNDEEPTNWNSNKTGGGFAGLGPQTCFRESSGVFSGSYCVRLRTGRILGNEVNGTVTTGRLEAPSTNPNDGYAHTVRNDPDFNTPFTGRPDSVVGYYKYTSVGGDAGAFQVILHGDADVRMPDPNNTTSSFIIGEANFDTPASNVTGWTRFSAAFDYTKTDTPKYILAIFTSSSDVSNASQGSTMWIDGVELVYNPVPCVATTDSITASACDSYTGPSGNFTWTSTGMYNDTIMNAAGCDSIITIDLTVDEVDLNVTQTGFVLTALEASADYQWLDCGQGYVAISGATARVFAPAQDGDYAVELRSGACVDTSMCVNVLGVSIEDEQFARDIRLHTLPAGQGYEIDLAQTYAQVRVQVVDLQGREVWQETFANKQILSLDLQALPQAMYVLKLVADGKTTAIKLLR